MQYIKGLPLFLTCFGILNFLDKRNANKPLICPKRKNCFFKEAIFQRFNKKMTEKNRKENDIRFA